MRLKSSKRTFSLSPKVRRSYRERSAAEEARGWMILKLRSRLITTHIEQPRSPHRNILILIIYKCSVSQLPGNLERSIGQLCAMASLSQRSSGLRFMLLEKLFQNCSTRTVKANVWFNINAVINEKKSEIAGEVIKCALITGRQYVNKHAYSAHVRHAWLPAHALFNARPSTSAVRVVPVMITYSRMSSFEIWHDFVRDVIWNGLKHPNCLHTSGSVIECFDTRVRCSLKVCLIESQTENVSCRNPWTVGQPFLTDTNLSFRSWMFKRTETTALFYGNFSWDSSFRNLRHFQPQLLLHSCYFLACIKISIY